MTKNAENNQAQASQPAAEETAESKGRLNVLKFRIDGYIPVNPRDPKKIVAASDALNEAQELLVKAGATIAEPSDAQFTTVAAAKD